MRRGFSIVVVLLLIAAGVAIGVGAYDAGYDRGLEANGSVQIVRTVGPGWGFFPGFFFFPLIIIAILFATRGFRHRGWHGGPGGHNGWSHVEERSAEWHRAQHEKDRDAGITA